MEDRDKFFKWLRQLATVAEHLDDFSHDAALANSRRAFSRSRVAEDLGQPGLDGDEASDQITRYVVLGRQSQASLGGSIHLLEPWTTVRLSLLLLSGALKLNNQYGKLPHSLLLPELWASTRL